MVCVCVRVFHLLLVHLHLYPIIALPPTALGIAFFYNEMTFTYMYLPNYIWLDLPCLHKHPKSSSCWVNQLYYILADVWLSNPYLFTQPPLFFVISYSAHQSPTIFSPTLLVNMIWRWISLRNCIFLSSVSRELSTKFHTLLYNFP